MQKKSLLFKVLSVALSLLMMLTVIPLVPEITADAAYSTEYYYPAGTRFIKDIVICYYKSQSECRAEVLSAVGGSANGYLLDYDLTRGTGGDYYVYMGWTWTTNPNEAVRGFRLDHNGSVPSSWYQSGVYWYPINSGVHSWVPQLHSDGCVDTNRGAGGDDIKIYITKDPKYGPPLTTAIISDGEGTRYSYQNQAGWKSAVTFQDNSNILDLNKGVNDSNYLYLHYYSSCTTVSTSALRTAYNNSAGYESVEGYTPASIGRLSSARQQAKTLFDTLDSSTNQGCASYTQTTINNLTNEINAALSNLQTYLYLDGTTNGGDVDQTITLTVGKNKTVQVNLGNYSATKAGADFAGWATSSLATSGTKETVTVGFNETWYALFGVELSATFHYLTPEGDITSETKNAYAMNAATAGGVLKPNAKDVTVDGRELEFLGWRTDTTATAQNVSATGIHTIYTAEPHVELYAVYSSPITLDYNVNKGEPEVEAVSQTQYFNANTVLSRTTHTFTVTDITPERFGGTYLGWADEINSATAQYQAGDTLQITDNKTLYAAYDMIYCTVTFVDADGNTISEQNIAYADDATAPETDPEKAYDETYHYTFTRWDTDFTNVTKDITVAPVFVAESHEGHYTVETIIKPDCLNGGMDKWICICEFSKEVPVGALGHDKALDLGTPATCTTDGSTDFVTCRRCLEVLDEREVIPALGHNYILDTACVATCSKGGYEIWVCSNNENHTEVRNETNPTGEHISIDAKGYEATCLENGLTDGTECLQCGSVLTAQSTILADGHNLITDAYVAPTCEDTGLTKGYHCEDCDYVVAQESIPALGHDWADFTAQAATCTEDGFTAGSKCRYCHEIIDSVTIPALEHNWQINEVAATCEADGYTEYICSYDEAHNYTEKGAAALGHTGGKATCKEQAVCDTCKQPYGETTTHDYTANVFAATCTKEGYTEYTCKACGDSYQADTTAVTKHTYDDGKVTTEPGCETDGVKTFTCINCDDSYEEVIAATGHTVNDWEIEDNMAVGDCEDCGEHFVENPEDVGLELPECERCGMVHKYNSGLFKYKGVYCSIVYFFRQIVNFFTGNA